MVLHVVFMYYERSGLYLSQKYAIYRGRSQALFLCFVRHYAILHVKELRFFVRVPVYYMVFIHGAYKREQLFQYVFKWRKCFNASHDIYLIKDLM